MPFSFSVHLIIYVPIIYFFKSRKLQDHLGLHIYEAYIIKPKILEKWRGPTV